MSTTITIPTNVTTKTFVYLPTGSIKDDYFDPTTMLLGEENKFNHCGFSPCEEVEGYPQLIRICAMHDMYKNKWQSTGDTSWCLLIDPVANWERDEAHCRNQAEAEGWEYEPTPKPKAVSLPKNCKFVTVTTSTVVTNLIKVKK